MSDAKVVARDVVAARRDELVSLSRAIHDRPELCFEEHEAAKAVGDTLAAGGLEVERGVYGLTEAGRAALRRWPQKTPTLAIAV